MAKTQRKTVKTASKTQSSKTDLVQVTDFDKPAEITEVGTKGPTEEMPVKDREPKPSTEMAPAISPEDHQVLRSVGAKLLTNAQVDESVSISCPNDKVIDLALKHGARGLVDEFAPADAVESTLAPVIVGLRNAVMASFHLAANGSAGGAMSSSTSP